MTKLKLKKVYIGVMIISLIVIQFSLLTNVSKGASMQPIGESNAPLIDGLKEESWENYNSTIISSFGVDKLVRVYSMFYDEKKDDVVTTYIYFGLYFKGKEHNETHESFALFLANEDLDTTNATNMWAYQDIKLLRIDGTDADQYVDAKNKRVLNDTVNDIEFAVNNNSENEMFYELRFPLSTNRTDDVNWSKQQDYCFRLYFGETYKNSTEDYAPDYENWQASGKITIAIGLKSENDFGDSKFWWESFGSYDLNTFIAKIIFFAIAAVIFVFIGAYILNSRKKLK
ncbi:MAG: hypothetical protein ACTSVI_04410 [Promethearchaeota archaeon]